MKAKNEITKDMTIAEVLDIDPAFTTILKGFGLHCLGCPMSRMETLEEASQVHSFDLKLMLKKLNAELNK